MDYFAARSTRSIAHAKPACEWSIIMDPLPNLIPRAEGRELPKHLIDWAVSSQHMCS